MIYSEEDFLQLSGLQHFKFCRRQWALIHIENQWAENYRTTDGAILHENAHNGAFSESRGDLLITRDMRIFSRSLGVSGACDVLEFHRGETGIPLKGRKGLWQPYPVEYKRGRPKEGAYEHTKHFNPRAPRGARRTATIVADNFPSISIHAPLAGRDYLIFFALGYRSEFQSTRPSRGATAKVHKYPCAFLRKRQ